MSFIITNYGYRIDLQSFEGFRIFLYDIDSIFRYTQNRPTNLKHYHFDLAGTADLNDLRNEFDRNFFNNPVFIEKFCFRNLILGGSLRRSIR